MKMKEIDQENKSAITITKMPETARNHMPQPKRKDFIVVNYFAIIKYNKS